MRGLAVVWLAIAGLVAQCWAAGVDTLPTRTIVDILSDRADFSVLLQLLQARDLVNTINTSWNSTLFAPVNSAFAGIDLNLISREHLLYHFVNASIVFAESDPNPDWLLPSYRRNDDGHSYMIHVNKDQVNDGAAEIVEKDLLASTDRGGVQAIDELLEVPESLCNTVFDHDELTFFSQLFHLDDACGRLSHDVTIYAPINSAFDDFSHIEKKYLFSAFGDSDRARLLSRHISKNQYGPQDLPTQVTMLDGSVFNVSQTMKISSPEGSIDPYETWVLASNGILNIYGKLLANSDFIEWTQEKYILALGGYNFAREVILYGHRHLIDGTYTKPQTILVPRLRDPELGFELEASFQEQMDTWDVPQAPLHRPLQARAQPDPRRRSPAILDEQPQREISNSVLYQFLTEKITLNTSATRSRLVDTAMSLRGSDNPQRVHLDIHKLGSVLFNWQPVISKAYEIGNTSIYVIEGEIPLPPTLSMALGPLFLSSHSLMFLDELNLLNLPLTDSWTLLLPTREAWERNILIKDYLASDQHALRKVFDEFIFKTPIYSDSKTQDVETISGDEVLEVGISKEESGSGYTVNVSGTVMSTEIVDVLFDNGVAHFVDGLRLPPDLEITSRDLIRAGGRGKFVDLLESRDLGWVLDASSDAAIIVPNLDAIAAANISDDSPEMDLLLKLHIVEGVNAFSELVDGDPVTTVADEDLVLRSIATNVYSISLVSALGRSVYVSAFGDTNGRAAAGSTVLFIDSFISPDWLHSPFLKPPFRLHTHTALLVGVVIGLTLTSLIVVALVYITSADKVDEHHAALISDVETGNEDVPEAALERRPSSNPIRTTHVSEDREFGQHLGLP